MDCEALTGEWKAQCLAAKDILAAAPKGGDAPSEQPEIPSSSEPRIGLWVGLGAAVASIGMVWWLTRRRTT